MLKALERKNLHGEDGDTYIKINEHVMKENDWKLLEGNFEQMRFECNFETFNICNITNVLWQLVPQKKHQHVQKNDPPMISQILEQQVISRLKILDVEEDCKVSTI